MNRLSFYRAILAAMLLLTATAGVKAVVYSVTNKQAVGVNLDLSPATTYTHKLDFPGDGTTTAINGVTFTTAAAGSFPTYSLAMPNLTANSSGSAAVLTDFFHISGVAPVGGVETLTLNGLTPGQTYDMRLYYRNFGPRPNNVVINTGSAPVAVVLDQATASNENYHSIKYMAEATSVTLTFAQHLNNASWHQYAVTNEILNAPQTSALLGGLFPTGVDANGATLANGAADPHYAFVAGPQASAAGAQATVQANNAGWTANDGQSKWIGVTSSGANNVAAGIYQYAINFEVPAGATPGTAVINGTWLADNGVAGTAILLNGVDTGVNFNAPFNGALPGTAFTITNGMGGATFLPGINTLTFVVNNPGPGANPGGLRVHNLSGTVAFIPEPSSAALLLLTGAACLRRSKRRA